MNDTSSRPGNVPEQSWLQSIGRRNLAYIAFVILLIPLASFLEAQGPQGPDAGGGIMLGLLVWAMVSLVFFVANAILLILAFVRQGNPLVPLVGCLLPVAVVVATLLAEDIWLR